MSIYILGTDSKVRRYDGAPGQWTLIADAADDLATDGGDHTYISRPIAGGRREILKYTRTPRQWVSIGTFAGSSRLYVWQGKVLHVGGDAGIYESNVNYANKLGDGAAEIACGEKIYMIRASDRALLESAGDKVWTEIGHSIGTMAVDGRALYITNRTTGELFQYDGAPHRWTRISAGNNAAVATGGGRVCVIGAADRRIYQYDGAPDRWTHIGDSAAAIAMVGATCLCLAGDGAIWRNNGAPHSWTPIGGGARLLAAREAPGMKFLVQPLPAHAMSSPIYSDAGRIFAISAAHSGLALTAPLTNGLVRQATWTERAEQQWQFVPTGDGSWFIRNVGTGRVLDVEHAWGHNGAALQAWDQHGGTNQRWRLEEIEAGHFTIRSVNSNRVLDVDAGKITEDAKIQQWDSNGLFHQKWILSEVRPRTALFNSAVEVFEHPNYTGRSQRLGLGVWNVEDLGAVGNDSISAVKVPAGMRATLYEHPGFIGTKLVIDADTPNVWPLGFDNRTSSIVIEKVVTLFEHPNYGGRSSRLGVGTYDLAGMGLPNDVVSSLRVPQGLLVTLFEHRFTGDYRNFTEDTPSVGSFDNRASSIVIKQIGVSVPRTAFRFGDGITLKSHHGRWMCAEATGRVVADRTGQGPWETFTLIRAGASTDNAVVSFGDVVALRGAHGKYLTAESNGTVNNNGANIGQNQLWKIVRAGGTQHTTFVSMADRVALQSVPFSRYLVAESNHAANANRGSAGPWETFMIGGTPSAVAGGMTGQSAQPEGPASCVAEACGADACWQDYCVADACGAAACGVAASLIGVCGVAATGIAACGADVAGIGACAAAACGAAAVGIGACGADACAAAACGAAACGAAACAAAACGADVCGAAACSADAATVSVAAVNVSVASVGLVIACAVDIRPANACAADACAVNLCPADACAADACAIDIIPIIPLI